MTAAKLELPPTSTTSSCWGASRCSDIITLAPPCDAFVDWPKRRATQSGALSISLTRTPPICAASLSAPCCRSSKAAGTATTASFSVSPVAASASARRRLNSRESRRGAEKLLASPLTITSTCGEPSLPLDTLKRQDASSSWKPGSSKSRPSSRRPSTIVLEAFRATCAFAASPRSVSTSVKAIHAGVMRFPCSLAIWSRTP
mmetsp:Transcript_33301/g.87643  ORF Transcript_33301/g.87643 Transcript_33301/m.87643 type:complete len:202 (-) Transcript_33301:103-708(-)